MATYDDWSQALVSYFTSGVPRGIKVYLSVDEEILDRIGEEFDWQRTADTWRDDFRAAVREQVIVGDRVDLQHLHRCASNSYPPGIAFLGLCVLAASQMAEEDKISERDYFKRLREVLGLSGFGRPPGMQFGAQAEEPLWEDWNRWLRRHGFESSAKRGPGGPTTYIYYPISQSLLRRADKDRLRLLFGEKQWKAQWDEMTLFANVHREAPKLSQHLKQLLKDRQRSEAIAEAIYEVYQQWLEYPEISANVPSAENNTCRRYLLAGLYRTEDPLLGRVDYYLYPKQQRGRKVESISVQQGDKIQLLKVERPGWYFPLEFPLNCSELDRGARYEIRDNPNLNPAPPLSSSRGNRLILPRRDFWILIPDPENPDAEDYATWGTPPLGTPFILLCKPELLSDLHRLRDERLIEWSGEPIRPFENSEWVELDQCMVISQAWDAVFIKNSELKEALQPTVRLAISLSGGLRVPQQNAWLEEYPPQIAVFGFAPTAQLTLTRISDNQPIYCPPSVKTNNKISIKFPSPGDYLIEATSGGDSSERFVRILPWDELAIAPSKRYEQLDLGSGYRICGSLIKRDSEIG